ncbi:MAG: hypothetical protein V8S96_02890 [Lachnospiraceae bacterium]
MYHFNSTDQLVTYGVELTNTGTVGRNRTDSISITIRISILRMNRIRRQMKLM